MPKRQEDEAPLQEAQAPATAKPARASRAQRDEPVAEATKAEPFSEPKDDQPATDEGKVKKLPLTEKCKKYLANISTDIAGNIYEIVEQVVEDTEKNKNNVCFVTFSPDGEDVDDIINEHTIKEVLFAYHTIPEKAPSGKAMVLEVLAPTEGEPYILVMQEV